MQKAGKIAQRVVLAIGILLFVFIMINLYNRFTEEASNNNYIIFIYAEFLLSAAVFVALTRKFKIPQPIIYVCLFALAFIYQITLSSQVEFIGDTDLKFYYTNAVDLNYGRFQQPNMYSATFPGTVSYPLFISFFMKIFGVDRMVPIIINHIAVCAVVCAVYGFLKYRMSTAWAAAGALLVAIHPFMIIYSNTPNAELLFGACMVLSVFCFDTAQRCKKPKAKLLWMSASAVICAGSVFFRPMGLILLIAVLLYTCLFSDSKWRSRLVICCMFAFAFFLFSQVNGYIVKRYTLYDAPKSSYGWNLYVGASETGKWNQEDADEFALMLKTASSPTEIQEYFADKAFERYKVMGLGIFEHGMSKLFRWFASEYVSFQTKYYDKYNTARVEQELTVNIREAEFVVLALAAIVDLPVMFFALIGCIWIYIRSFSKTDGGMLLITLYLTGSFMALMVLELSPRYTLSYRMMFCVLAVYVANRLWKKITSARKPPQTVQE